MLHHQVFADGSGPRTPAFQPAVVLFQGEAAGAGFRVGQGGTDFLRAGHHDDPFGSVSEGADLTAGAAGDDDLAGFSDGLNAADEIVGDGGLAAELPLGYRIRMGQHLVVQVHVTVVAVHVLRVADGVQRLRGAHEDLGTLRHQFLELGQRRLAVLHEDGFDVARSQGFDGPADGVGGCRCLGCAG